MKKLFTLALGAVCALGAMAQDFGFCNAKGEIYPNGGTVSCTEIVTKVPNMWYEMEPEVSWVGKAGENYTIEGEVPTEYRNLGEYLQICGFNNLCVQLTTGFYKQDGDATGKPSDMQMHYSLGVMHPAPTEYCEVKITIYATDDPDNARTLTVVYDPQKTGIHSIISDNNAPVEYFNILGVKVANPTRGQVLIRRQGNKATKVVIK